jgi:ribosomal protein L37AE/L43A
MARPWNLNERGDIDHVQWASRVPQAKIRRLYELDAQGIVDEALIDEVAYGMAARCQSIVLVTAAEHGRVYCPLCDDIIPRLDGSKQEVLRCDACDWEVTWGEYLRTYQRKQLSGGSAIAAFGSYIDRLARAHTPQARMLLVDWLIHQVHRDITNPDHERWRPAAVNLIEGTMHTVTHLLEELACGQSSSATVQRTRQRWDEEVYPHLWSAQPQEEENRKES